MKNSFILYKTNLPDFIEEARGKAESVYITATSRQSDAIFIKLELCVSCWNEGKPMHLLLDCGTAMSPDYKEKKEKQFKLKDQVQKKLEDNGFTVLGGIITSEKTYGTTVGIEDEKKETKPEEAA